MIDGTISTGSRGIRALVGLAHSVATRQIMTVQMAMHDLLSANDLELATIPSVGPKSLAILYGLMGTEAQRTEGPDERNRAEMATDILA